ncbi:MAG: hypothetical protein KAW56_02670, partial [Candidatus Marinimicrobia bacterium]|nr:hypothetical protein [Candidatus Neomarinimicrobiota bacterium]
LNMTNVSGCSRLISEFSHNIKEQFIPVIFEPARLVDNVTDRAKPCQTDFFPFCRVRQDGSLFVVQCSWFNIGHIHSQ